MTIIVAENTPDRIRGILKRWFLEPKPNTFVGSVNIRVTDNLVKYLRRQSCEWNAMIFVNSNNIQGYKIYQIGETKYHPIKKTGLDFIATKLPQNNSK